MPSLRDVPRIGTVVRSHNPSRRRSPIVLPQRDASVLSTFDTFSEDPGPPSPFQAPEAPSTDTKENYDPVSRAKKRRKQLPPSRYQFRPPRYYRGPLHPHQPPPPSDISSREFIPGPFSIPRLAHTYNSTVAPDLMTLMYKHYPPGKLPGPVGQRLRSWDDSSPYHKGRPLRKPRGGPTLPLLQRNITFRNIPTLEKIVVHSFIKDSASTEGSQRLHVAGMVLQAITNVRATTHDAKMSIMQFGIKKGKACSVTSELRGEDMWGFVSKMVDLVMPRIKDFRGVSGKSGDSSGDIGWGMGGEVVGLFPEVMVNYDAYPQKMIPSIDVTICTTATNDRDARLLLSSLGIPFYGKHVN